MKYSDQITEWLVDMGYTHCFYVGGGNIMHLLESFSKKLDCRAVIHEVAAGIATEYFNEISGGAKALALVTAGPGITNMVTALAGAYLESRELLVIGGQVKTADLARGTLRQRGIQEIDGVSIVRPVTVRSELVDAPIDFPAFAELVLAGSRARKGPVFLEMPLDVQARDVSFSKASQTVLSEVGAKAPKLPTASFDELVANIRRAERPVFLLGGGITRATAASVADRFGAMGIPIATTWNAADRIDASHPEFIGRPNTWGQRSANLLLQQTDFLVALGTRLGMQQTGFNWQQFVPVGRVAQVEIDPAELAKGHPHVDFPLLADANEVLLELAATALGAHDDWVQYCQEVRHAVPLIEDNPTREAYISPFVFADRLSDLCRDDDIIVPCSSGGAFTVMMQAFRQRAGQTIVTNKGLASMGYGLSGAIGAAFAQPDRRVILVEGDGGFSQNLQEIGTAAINELNLKIFVFDDAGYASIRMTQRNYFGGRYVGCDRDTGLGLPTWDRLFGAWDVPVVRATRGYENDPSFLKLFESNGCAAFIVSVDPEQTYFPKITSRITESGAMESNPLHRMSPDLEPNLYAKVARFIA